MEQEMMRESFTVCDPNSSHFLKTETYNSKRKGDELRLISLFKPRHSKDVIFSFPPFVADHLLESCEGSEHNE